MEFKSFFNNFKGKSSRFITFILIGMLLLIIIMPVKNKGGLSDNSGRISDTGLYSGASSDGSALFDTYSECADYYEEKLKNILEKSYGEGTMSVMVSLKASDDNGNYYDNAENGYVVDGVLIVADITGNEAAADIAFAVCSLFNLPAHKVAVLIKN